MFAPTDEYDTRKQNDNSSVNTPEYAAIASYYGEEAQMKIAIEECAELIQAICKLSRTVEDGVTEARKHYVEELTDVIIMVSQLRWLLSDKEKKMLDDMYRFKIGRQLGRIEREKEENNAGRR